MTLEQKHLLGDEWVDDGTHVFESVSPVTGRVLWQGPAAGVDQISLAVIAARGAFYDWRRLIFAERASYVLRFIDRIEAQRDELAMVIHEETGKPFWESKTEIATMIAKAAVSIKAYEERTGQRDAELGGDQLALTHRPIGVFTVLGPYNFPGHLPNGHIIPALLAGNTIVFKPSELTPLFGERMVQCWVDAGLPAGVVNLVQGGAGAG
ncbi:MAG: aldehyde dehydrogenase family protein, partial [Pseudomonadota bacterium]|nr:aldehyde dehydrogenase family protein [Pseudomonadota bacterium]